jgi:hypothetical protein
MLDWNRQIIDYYRDRFLLGPLLLFSLLAIANVVAPESPTDRLYGFKLTACAVIAVILARERLAIILAGPAFVTVRLAVALACWVSFLLAFTGLLMEGPDSVVVQMPKRIMASSAVLRNFR